jgi:hypothetical protein
LLKDLSAEATVAGIVSKIRKLTQIFGHLGKDFPIYIDKDCLINLKKHRVKTISAENFTQTEIARKINFDNVITRFALKKTRKAPLNAIVK